MNEKKDYVCPVHGVQQNCIPAPVSEVDDCGRARITREIVMLCPRCSMVCREEGLSVGEGN